MTGLQTLAQRSAWRGIGVASVVVMLSACAASNVVIRRRPADDNGAIAAFARCEATEKPCQDDPTFDSSRFNASHTAFLSLPNCAYGIQQILIQDSGSSDAVAIVRCSAPPPVSRAEGTGIPTTSEGGGTTPAP